MQNKIENNKHLLVLAGGFGTRLKSVVADVPKPLAQINGLPFLQLMLCDWLKQGLCEITFLLHYSADKIKEFLNSENIVQLLRPIKLNVIVEKRPMGTGGAIAHAIEKLNIKGEFFVSNADTWLEGGLNALSHKTSPAIGIIEVENTERYGSVTIDCDLISGFKEKQYTSGAGWINAGVYLLSSEQFSTSTKSAFSLERDMFPSLIKQRKVSYAKINSNFIDIGVPEDYFRFVRWCKEERKGAL